MDKVKEVVIGSLDVYPSIDQREGPRIVAEEFLKSRLEYDNVDYHLVGVYLSICMDRGRLEKEGILHLVQRRKSGNKGRRPTVHTRELGGPKPRWKKDTTDVEVNKERGWKEEGCEEEEPVHIGKSKCI